MRRADRLFQIVHMLRAQPVTTGGQLADTLGVSKRTIYRDVQDLQRSGVPIRGEAGVGYALNRRFELPPMTFTSAELEGLVLGARIVAAWGDPELAAAVGSAMSRIEGVLPDALRKVVLETALFAAGFPRQTTMAREVAVMRRAISEHRRLHFAYTRADGEQTERSVRPLALFFWGDKWTLASWCEMRGDYRSFRPDRMTDVRLLDTTFDVRGDINLRGFMRETEEREQRLECERATPRRSTTPRVVAPGGARDLRGSYGRRGAFFFGGTELSGVGSATAAGERASASAGSGSGPSPVSATTSTMRSRPSRPRNSRAMPPPGSTHPAAR